MKTGGQRDEFVSHARSPRGAKAPPAVGDHPVPGGQHGCPCFSDECRFSALRPTVAKGSVVLADKCLQW
jgi:hypothetical protein